MTETLEQTDAPTVEHKRATVRPDKAEVVAELAEAFRSASAAVLTEYRGLSVKQISELRRALGADTTYAVVKNTLTTIAARDAGLDGLDDLLNGPTAVAFVNGDPVEAAKGLRDFARTNPVLVVKGGVMDGKPLTADEVRRLADLESREVLLGKLAGAMLGSLSQAVYLLNAPLAQAARLVGALQAKAEQDPSVLGGGAGTPAAPEAAEDATAESPTDPGPTDEGTTDADARTDAPPASPAPAADAPASDLPASDLPASDAPADLVPAAEVEAEVAAEVAAQPGTDSPGTDSPGTDSPGTDSPGTDSPGTDSPGTDSPGTDSPGTDSSAPDSSAPE